MPPVRRLLTNMSKGELDPLIEGRPDLAAYFEGGSIIENFYIMRQGGLTRRPGLLFIREIKDSLKDTILLPFESSINDAYIIELGDSYLRVVKERIPLSVDISTPYTLAKLRNIHYTQSADVMTLFHESTPQQNISRLSDTNWSIGPIGFNPPPTFEDDFDVSGGTVTITPGATSGSPVVFTASANVFLSADVGRYIIFGTSRARIITLGTLPGPGTSPNNVVTTQILNNFPNTSPIPAGQWFLRLSPQTPITPDISGPVGAWVTVTANGIDTWRPVDFSVRRYLSLYGGLIEIQSFISSSLVAGVILSPLQMSTPTPTSAWTFELQSWSDINGYPRSGDYYQGRLGQTSTFKEPTAFWLSATDGYDDYATGVTAERAIAYTIASRQLNRNEWMADNVELFIGASGGEFRVKGAKQDEPLGGDHIPLPQKIDTIGSAPIQPIVTGKRVIFVDRSRKRVYLIAYDLNEDGPTLSELTGAASHIMGSGVRLGPIAYSKRPDPRIYFIREDGQLVTLTYFVKEKVIGFTRLVTDGLFEAVAVVPQVNRDPDAVYVIVKRTINGQTKRYIELLASETMELSSREWTQPCTDACKVYNLNNVPTTVLTGLSHLEGRVVDVITDGSFRGTKTVVGGQITLTEPASKNAEVGLHSTCTFTTMRPAVEGQMVEGLQRMWSDVWLRLHETIGGQVKTSSSEFVDIQYPADPLNTNPLKTGDVFVNPSGQWTDDERITVQQDQPYPMTLLAVFGDIEFSG